MNASRVLPDSIIALFRNRSRNPKEHGSASEVAIKDMQRRRTSECNLKVNEMDFVPPKPRPRSHSLPAVSPSILKKDSKVVESARLGRVSSKQFCFNEDVNVVYYEEEEETGEYTEKDSSKLKSGPNVEAYPEDINTEPVKSPSLSGDPDSLDECKGRLYGNSSLILHKEIKVIPCVDSKGCRRQTLKIIIKTDDRCLKERTSVKAVSAGSSIMVTLHRKLSQVFDSPMEKCVEKISLPVVVDPYKVKAHLLKTGELEINGPLKE